MIPVLDSRLTNLDVMIPLVRQRVSGPLDGMIRKAIVRAAIDFCKRSAFVHLERHFDRVYEGQTVSFAKSSSLNRQARTTIDAPQITGSVIHQVQSCGKPLRPGGDYHVQSAESIRFLGTFHDVLIIGAVEPVVGATYLPTALIEDYSEALADGAASVLQEQPGKPWQDPNSSAYLARRFNDAVRDAYRMRVEQTPNAQVQNPVRRRDFF
ncbi:hypothetical protein [Aeromonas enteropelogenes]|uniref:hypothetical protein n=1 Tax=Aeromonas enteropelogenes TaxID=29489 RepID=UPI003BA286BF